MSILLIEWEESESLEWGELVSVDSNEKVNDILDQEYKYYLEGLFARLFEDLSDNFWFDEKSIDIDSLITWLLWVDIESWIISDRKSTRLNSSHTVISYAVFCLKKKKNKQKVRLSDQGAQYTKT